MNNTLMTAAVAALMLCAAATAAQADIRLKFKTSQNGREGESTIRFKGRRQRNDFIVKRPDGTTATGAYIFQCDLKRQLWLDDTKRVFYEYELIPIQEFMARGEARNAQQPPPPKRKREVKYDGHIVETFTVMDTGERKEIFGYPARRIKTMLTWDIKPLDCPLTTMRKETDGWYIDLLYGTVCSYDISGYDEGELTAVEQSKCVDYYLGMDGKHEYGLERKQVGTARFGFPVVLQVKSYSDDGRPSVRTSEVTEISNEELEASLFETPAGYSKFKPPKRSFVSRALSVFGKE